MRPRLAGSGRPGADGPAASGRARRLLAVAVALLALAAPAAAAQCPRTTLGDVEDEVMCPVCGTPLGLATEAPQAERQRELIRRLVDDCRSKEEVKRVLVAEYGAGVLALPGAAGFDLAAYLVPAIGILVAGAAVGLSALRWRRRRRDWKRDPPYDEDPGSAGVREPRPPSGVPPNAAAAARLDSDLDRYEL